MLERREVRRTFVKAPCVPIDGAPAVSTSIAKLRVDFVLSDDNIALRAMDVYSKYSPLTPARPKTPQGVWDAFSQSMDLGLWAAQRYSDG